MMWGLAQLGRTLRRGRRHSELVLIAIAASAPVLLAAVRGVLAGWTPLGDEALSGLSAYDVFTGHLPVMGPRTTTAFETGIESHHPGPLLYYMLAPASAVAGGAPWGLIVGSLGITLALVAVGVLAAHRVGGALLAAGVGAAFLGMQWALGPDAGARPFNPYPPAFATLTFFVLVWALLDERLEYVPHLVVVTSVMLQGHIGYVPFLALPLVVLVLTGLVRWWVRRRAVWPLSGWRPADHGRYRWSAWAAVCLGGLLWLPPAVELFTYSPNNLQQVLAYVAADRGDPVATPEVLRFIAGLLAPVPDGLQPALTGAGHVGAHLSRQATSTTAVVLGSVHLLLTGAIATGRWRILRVSATDRIRPFLPTRSEARGARVALLALAALVLTMTRLPASSAKSSWNYLQAWPVVFFVLVVLITYALRRLIDLTLDRTTLPVPRVAIGTLLVGGLLAAWLSPATSRWHEGDGVAAGSGSFRDSLAAIAQDHEGTLHVTFDGDTLGAGYYVAPALAHLVKDEYAIHLPAVWSAAEDTDFRKSVTSPEDTAWVSIRDSGSWTGTSVDERARAVTTVTDGSGHVYTLYVRGPDPS
jgi:hypothetical protein